MSEFRSLIELFEGDPEIHRRQHRRFPMRLPALIQTDREAGHGIVLNFSGNGLFIASKHLARMGSVIQLKVGRPGELEYLFVCTVRHLRRNVHFFGIGCEFCAPPKAIKSEQVEDLSGDQEEQQPARLRPFVPYQLPVLGRGESLCSLSPF